MPRCLRSLVVLPLAACCCSPSAGQAPSGALAFDFPEAHRTIEFLTGTPDASPLFEISTSISGRGDIDETITAADFQSLTIERDGNTSVAVFEGPPALWGGNIRVEITFRQLESEIEARLSIDSESYFPIQRIRFPVIREKEVPYDTLLLSHPMGDAIHYPSRVIGGRLSGIISYRYPATLAMQYMVLFNQGRSLYISAYHLGDEVFEHTVRTDRGYLKCSIDWFPFIERGTWESSPVGFGMFPGGWHSSADLYRSRMARHFQPPPIPKWLREDFDGWLQLSLESDSDPPRLRYDELPEFYETYVAPLGLNNLQLFSWQENYKLKDYPRCWASENCGGADALRTAMEDIEAMGGRVGLYVNGRLIDPTTYFYRDGGASALALNESGGGYTETYSRVYYVACPYAKAYNDAMFENAERMLRIYGNNSLFFDQINCTYGPICYSTEHGHTKPSNAFIPGLTGYLSRIRDLYTELDPDFFVWAEGCNELTGRYVHVHQSHGEEMYWTVGDSLPEQYRYTYPNHIVMGQANDIFQMCHTFGQGKPFDFHFRRVTDRNSHRWVPLFKDLVRVRKSEPGYFYRGVFKDTVGLEVCGIDIRHWGIEREDGDGLMTNFWARGRDLGQPAEAAIRHPRPGAHPRVVYPDSLKIVAQGGDWYGLEWVGPIACVVWE